MADFSHLKKYNAASDKVVEYPLYELSGDEVLHLSSASENNKGYFNAVLRKTGKAQRAIKGGISANLVKQNREEDKELYAKHILKGWSGILDSEGNEVAFSHENAEAFLKALPNHIFDGIRAFAADVQNFVDTVDVETKAKNSQNG